MANMISTLAILPMVFWLEKHYLVLVGIASPSTPPRQASSPCYRMLAVSMLVNDSK
jgi:hypothetical protein